MFRQTRIQVNLFSEKSAASHIKILETNRVKKNYTLLLCLIISSCSATQRHPDKDPVRLIFYNELNIIAKQTVNCQYLGTLISSQGHWYDYLFITNPDLVRGATNDMSNKANEIGANIVYINNNIDFATSVTLLGQAYHCIQKDDHRPRQQRY